MFTFLEMLAMVISESSFGDYVCHRRPVVLHRNERSGQGHVPVCACVRAFLHRDVHTYCVNGARYKGANSDLLFLFKRIVYCEHSRVCFRAALNVLMREEFFFSSNNGLLQRIIERGRKLERDEDFFKQEGQSKILC